MAVKRVAGRYVLNKAHLIDINNMADCRKTIVTALTELSVEKADWATAAREWVYAGLKRKGLGMHCVCGVKIDLEHTVHNRLTGYQAIVGSTCVRKFMTSNEPLIRDMENALRILGRAPCVGCGVLTLRSRVCNKCLRAEKLQEEAERLRVEREATAEKRRQEDLERLRCEDAARAEAKAAFESARGPARERLARVMRANEADRLELQRVDALGREARAAAFDDGDDWSVAAERARDARYTRQMAATLVKAPTSAATEERAEAGGRDRCAAYIQRCKQEEADLQRHRAEQRERSDRKERAAAAERAEIARVEQERIARERALMTPAQLIAESMEQARARSHRVFAKMAEEAEQAERDERDAIEHAKRVEAAAKLKREEALKHPPAPPAESKVLSPEKRKEKWARIEAVTSKMTLSPEDRVFVNFSVWRDVNNGRRLDDDMRARLLSILRAGTAVAAPVDTPVGTPVAVA